GRKMLVLASAQAWHGMLWVFQGCQYRAAKLKEMGMSRHSDFLPQGVIPAVLLPFHDDLSIDEASFRAHLRDVGAVPGLSAITINAHSTELASCTGEEQRRVMERTGEEVGDRLPIIHGVWADGSLEVARIARHASDSGSCA